MERVTVLYPNMPDSHFDLDYYVKTHMSKVCHYLGQHLIRCDIASGQRSAQGQLPMRVTASIYLDSTAAFTAMLREHGDEILGDIKKYTNIEPTICYETIQTLFPATPV